MTYESTVCEVIPSMALPMDVMFVNQYQFGITYESDVCDDGELMLMGT